MSNTKKCTKCGKELPLDQYLKQRYKNGKIGLRPECRECTTIRYRKWRQNNPEKDRATRARYREDNLDKIRESYTKWRQNNPDYGKEWRQNNPDYGKEWHNNHPEYDKERRRNNPKEFRAMWAKQKGERKNNDPDFRMMCNIRAAMSSALRDNKKTGHTEELLGCSIEQARHYLENQFTDGMTWENYGRRGWHVDHIIPLSHFNFSDPEQQKRAWHYTNLRPMWAKDNIRKGNKIIEIQLVLI